uniref:uncharacterized protein LOC122764865 n=1 Tax=Solea senegalensis TaxID=28829 RepID=UPI001CD82900|nr:uncharacterized protein LOC122764865 [Solea senegalensis]
MSVLTTNIQVSSTSLRFQESKLVSECYGFGDEYTCSCTDSYMWVNDICYTYGCCNGTDCKITGPTNISLCTAKVKVLINGSIKTDFHLSSAQVSMVRNAFRQLSGNEDVNFTTTSAPTAKFETALSVKATVSKFKEIMTSLESNLGAPGVLALKVEGLVNIESPSSTVFYKTSVHFNCTFDTDTAQEKKVWHFYKNTVATILNTGSVVTLNHTCDKQGNLQCTSVNLKEVTGLWKGKYKTSHCYVEWKLNCYRAENVIL